MIFIPAYFRMWSTGIACISLLFLTACGSRTTNSLQNAVDEIADAATGEPHPGVIVDQEVQGDWAYVRTEGPGVMGKGEFVTVSTPQGLQWTSLIFSTFEVEGGRLKLRAMKFGGQLAQQKERTVDSTVREMATKRWKDYLRSENLTLVTPNMR